jgi:lipopolysaccharide transport system ATP-binding protein
MGSTGFAVRVKNVSKCYRIGLKDEMHDSFGASLIEFIKSPLKNYRKYRSLYRFDDLDAATDFNSQSNCSDVLWALRDVSFDVRKGEVVGIIGRNGAGKSTLLKILSKITDPVRGSVEIYGRIASLLEVGTGFHPELTGRENIYLNGTILGMRKDEIDRKFDEIVDFSGVEKFIDTPVKRYSSGMAVRLAFSVAAHLETDILIVDEVLAVGDVAFQRKCIGKMEKVTQQGRTVLFVSHNMAALQALCTRAILLERGTVVENGPVGDVIRKYLDSLAEAAENVFEINSERVKNSKTYFTGATVLNGANLPTKSLIAGQPASFELRYLNLSGPIQAKVAMTIYNHLGIAITHCNTDLTGFVVEKLGTEGAFRCRIPSLPLNIGQYRVAIALNVNGRQSDHIANALTFEVEDSTFFPGSRTPDVRYCTCMTSHDWDHKTIT